MKKAIFSGIDSGGGPPVTYLDGHKNPGFSGGPVVFANYFQGDRLEIAGVIAGYRIQPVFVEEALVDNANRSSDYTQKKTVRFVRENSGLIVAFDINTIVTAIRKNRIGISVKRQPKASSLYDVA